MVRSNHCSEQARASQAAVANAVAGNDKKVYQARHQRPDGVRQLRYMCDHKPRPPPVLQRHFNKRRRTADGAAPLITRDQPRITYRLRHQPPLRGAAVLCAAPLVCRTDNLSQAAHVPWLPTKAAPISSPIVIHNR